MCATPDQGHEAAAPPAVAEKVAEPSNCYVDKANRDLPVRKPNGSKAQCEESCAGYKFMGRQWTKEW